MTEVPKACAVCGYPLEHKTKLDGTSIGWLHIRPDHQDHPAVPVDPAEIRVNHRCDFCDGEPVTAIVLCTSFVTPLGGPESESVGNWAACTECGELVRRRRWSRLVTRVRHVAMQTGLMAGRIPRADLESMYAMVQAHMLGTISVTEWLERLEGVS